MYVADSKRLTAAGARKMMATAIAEAERAGIAISVAIVDAGGGVRRADCEGGRGTCAADAIDWPEEESLTWKLIENSCEN